MPPPLQFLTVFLLGILSNCIGLLGSQGRWPSWFGDGDDRPPMPIGQWFALAAVVGSLMYARSNLIPSLSVAPRGPSPAQTAPARPRTIAPDARDFPLAPYTEPGQPL
jgi:hypothetical protein